MSGLWEDFRVALWRWGQRWKAWRSNKKPLREFVYLDETSVYSLYASRFGEIPAEKTDTLTQVRQSEVGGSLGTNTAPVKTGLTSRAMSSQSQESQVVSRAIVQSTFKDLLEKERSSLALSHVADFEKTPDMNNVDMLKAGGPSSSRLKRLKRKGFVVDPDTLLRGSLLEIEVELDTEFIFQFSSVLQALVGMARKNPTMFGADETQMGELGDISGIIEELLVGLVPLRGKAIDYSVLVFDDPQDGKLLVHKRLLENLEHESGFTAHPLYIVGVAEEPLFWKDIRRVLFARQKFRVLCRVARDGIDTSWIPLKLQQVVSSLFPPLGAEIEKINRGALFEGELDDTSLEEDADQSEWVKNALLIHARWIAESGDFELAEDDKTEIARLAKENGAAFDTARDKRAVFNKLEDHLADSYQIEIDREAVKNSRSRACQEAATDPSSAPDLEADSLTGNSSDTQTQSGDFFLDSEFVAVYW